jgi:hypothetical protein
MAAWQDGRTAARQIDSMAAWQRYSMAAADNASRSERPQKCARVIRMGGLSMKLQ